MLLVGSNQIRDVIAFPKTTSAMSLMDNSPSAVDEIQLDEYEDDILLGDVNGDEIINVLDVVSVVGHIMESNLLQPPYDQAADLNEDGVINVLDVVGLVNIILS